MTTSTEEKYKLRANECLLESDGFVLFTRVNGQTKMVHHLTNLNMEDLSTMTRGIARAMIELSTQILGSMFNDLL